VIDIHVGREAGGWQVWEWEKKGQTDNGHRHSDRKASSWECWQQQGIRR
jgi:hypothetical protein